MTVLILGVITALNVDDLPLIGAGTTYSAEFSEAAGLRPDDEVRIAGVKVGTVSAIELSKDTVTVSFRVKKAWLGSNTAATIKIKTVLGRKYLSLDPRGGQVLDPARAIPRNRTQAPYDVMETFRGISATVNEIDLPSLAKSFDTLSTTFGDTPDDAKSALNGLSRLSTTIAERDSQLTNLLANTTKMSGTLADHSSEVSKILNDGNDLLNAISNRKQAVSALLDGTKTLAETIRGIVADNEKQLGPVLTELDQLTATLQRNQDSLNAGIAQLAPFTRTFSNVTGGGHWFDAYLCGLILPTAGPVNEQGC